MTWVVDASDHGAVGDGTTDDTQALQDALDAAAGRWLVIPPGAYMSNRLYIRPRTTVEIVGGATVKFLPQNRTTSQWGGVFNVHGTTQDPIEDVMICGGGRVDGSKGSHTNPNLNIEGIDLDHARGCVARDITVVDAESDGIDLDSCTDCLIDGVVARGCGGWGVHISHGNTRVKVANATAIACGHDYDRGGFDAHAILGTATTVDCSYVGCVALDCRRGFYAKADRTSIIGCRSEGGVLNDLRLRVGSGIDVTGFKSKNSEVHGITVEGSVSRARLSDITVRTATQAGIRVLGGAERVSITGGHVTDCGGHGIHFSGADGLIASNLVKGNASSPQIRDSGTGNTVTANAT